MALKRDVVKRDGIWSFFLKSPSFLNYDLLHYHRCSCLAKSGANEKKNVGFVWFTSVIWMFVLLGCLD